MADRTCSIEDCNAPFLARDMCNKHLIRWRKHGDPMIVLPPSGGRPAGFSVPYGSRPAGPAHHNWKGASADYTTKHQRVYHARGKAKSYPCIWQGIGDDCMGPMHWANMTGDYDDIWDFEPACKRHHQRYDRARAAQAA